MCALSLLGEFFGVFTPGAVLLGTAGGEAEGPGAGELVGSEGGAVLCEQVLCRGDEVGFDWIGPARVAHVGDFPWGEWPPMWGESAIRAKTPPFLGEV